MQDVSIEFVSSIGGNRIQLFPLFGYVANQLKLSEKIESNRLFFLTESTKKYHSPTWRNVCERLGPKVPSIDPKQLIDGDYLLCLHIFIIYKLREQPDSGAKITLLQSIFKQLENYNTK